MLTSKERSELRARANALETTLMVGKEGVTEAVAAEADRLLTARELVREQRNAYFREKAIERAIERDREKQLRNSQE